MRRACDILTMALIFMGALIWACVLTAGFQKTVDAQAQAQCHSSLAMAQADASHYEAVAQTQRSMAYAAMEHGKGRR